jgi:hypothetical protein
MGRRAGSPASTPYAGRATSAQVGVQEGNESASARVLPRLTPSWRCATVMLLIVILRVEVERGCWGAMLPADRSRATPRCPYVLLIAFLLLAASACSGAPPQQPATPTPARAAAQATQPPPTRPPATLAPTAPPAAPAAPGTGAQACGADAISSADAASAVGKQVTVCIERAYVSYRADVRGQPTFINDAPFPNHKFTALVWGENRSAFQPPPEQAYGGKSICVTGPVTTAPDGKPQIVVRSPDQIRVL